MRRPHQSTSQSPSRHRVSDELLSRLSPPSAVEALRVPSGPLKACLSNASAFEQSFAMKTAVASKSIHDWVDELSGWPWPAGGGSAGFEMPPTPRRKLSGPSDTPREDNPSQDEGPGAEPETEYLGSLPAEDVDQYDKRIDQIQKEMDDLDLEDIKTQVLQNHILPLSRPGTPFSDSGHSVASTSFVKMEDLTAVITAITVQALPNLSRLSRLLNIWSVRLAVLRKVPTLLSRVTEAEVALKSGWNAIQMQLKAGKDAPADTRGSGDGVSALTRKEFESIKAALQQLVANPGRDADYMLDALEGMADILPDEWLDRLEAVERSYAEWVVTADRQVREGEWSNMQAAASLSASVGPRAPQPEIHIQVASPTQEEFDNRSLDYDGVHEQRPTISLASKETTGQEGKTAGNSSRAHGARSHDGADDGALDGINQTGPVMSETDKSIGRLQPSAMIRPGLDLSKGIPDLEAEYSFLESVVEESEEEEEELELPPPRFQTRRESQGSLASLLACNDSDEGRAGEESPELELPRLPDPDRPLSSDAISPSSSPPLRYKPRSASVTFKELPEIAPMPEPDDTPPRTPLEHADVFDADTTFEFESRFSTSGRTSVMGDTDQLHKQIHHVLSGLPAKIRLTTRPSAINLNPPDLVLPTRSRQKTPEPFRRSGSAVSTMSSRAGTPSWLMAPAKTPRPRSKNSQEARHYYLSRSAGEAPLKLLIRCVGENGERVMVRVGGGWADLGEYLKEYAVHHGRRSQGEGKIEVRDVPAAASSRAGSSPPSRPVSALDSPKSPLHVRKTRKSLGEEGATRMRPKTPLAMNTQRAVTPSSANSANSAHSSSSRSRTPSRAGYEDESSVLGMSGPRPNYEEKLSEEGKAWVEDVQSKVRSASGGRATFEHLKAEGKLGELGKVGGTKRVFRKNLG
ncbi:uncharacterized protein BCR38DRAFT_330978 [Pseudomassariella vexata]|uniref:GAR domain-containing protein n=1 Tax=Pseudomassariella vexata TaxID=1141098 RepID=A0A1Y2EI51_9PEZI|nr:uncharacterized protein BCR38DRAFT_330978 [Pseudomassariella vexata]ORY71250.1 hypothetical protein BCR38DRAFT_330978 [Pseudomassariella vexata]